MSPAPRAEQSTGSTPPASWHSTTGATQGTTRIALWCRNQAHPGAIRRIGPCGGPAEGRPVLTSNVAECAGQADFYLLETLQLIPHRTADGRDHHPEHVHGLARRPSACLPPAPDGAFSPMSWGMVEQVIDRFATAGIPEASIAFDRASWQFHNPGRPADFLDDFRTYYGPTMNAYAAAAQQDR
jgi:hypothetical protein